MATRIDYYPASEIFLHSPGKPRWRQSSVTIGTTQKSRAWSASHSQGYHATRTIRTSRPLDTSNLQWLPSEAHSNRPASGLSRATRLHGQTPGSGQLSERHTFNMNRERLQASVLNWHRWSHYMPSSPTSLRPVLIQFKLGFFPR
jgi:hypothetical protein